LADGFPFAALIACFFSKSAEFARPMVRVSSKEGGFSDGDDFWALQKTVDAKRQKTVLPSRVLERVGNIFIVASMPMQRGP
jgi:type II secretory pathway component PulK